MKQRVGRAAGFTLIEALVVLAIVGLLTLVTVPPINSAWQRSRLETTAGDIRSFLQSAYTEAGIQHGQVEVTLRLVNGKMTLQLNPPPAPPRTANGTYVLPDYVSVDWNPTSANGGWPADSTSSPTVRGLTCDPNGLTLMPADAPNGGPGETPGSRVLQTKTLSITHVNMVDGSLTPRVRYDIQLYPLWNVTIRKVLP